MHNIISTRTREGLGNYTSCGHILGISPPATSASRRARSMKIGEAVSSHKNSVW